MAHNIFACNFHNIRELLAKPSNGGKKSVQASIASISIRISIGNYFKYGCAKTLVSLLGGSAAAIVQSELNTCLLLVWTFSHMQHDCLLRPGTGLVAYGCRVIYACARLPCVLSLQDVQWCAETQP